MRAALYVCVYACYHVARSTGTGGAFFMHGTLRHKDLNQKSDAASCTSYDSLCENLIQGIVYFDIV
jgi:hypothetical protein